MVYKNYTNEALYELEKQRMLGYEKEEDIQECMNGCCSSSIYNVEGRVLCEDCLIEEVRDVFMDMLEQEDEDNYSAKIVKDIISDFSDSEILAYIENRYDKI